MVPKLTPKQDSVVNAQWSPGVATAAVLGLWSPSWAGLLTSSKGDGFVVGHGGKGRKLSIYFKILSPCHPQREGSMERETINFVLD